MALLPCVAGPDPGQLRDALGERFDPFGERARSGERIGRGFLESGDEFGEPTGQFDSVAGDVVERQRGVQPRLGVIRHRHSGQDAVDPELPGVVQDVFESVWLAVLGVEAPPDIRLAHPVGDGVEMVVGEPEAGAHRRGLGEVEHLAGGDATPGDGEQFRGHTEKLIGLGQRAVSQLDAQPVCGMRVAGQFTKSEVGDDQRRVGLDVGTHHHDVARLERRVIGQQAEQHFAQHVDLPGRAVAAVHLNGSVAFAELATLWPLRVGGKVGLQPAQEDFALPGGSADVLVRSRLGGQ